MANTAPPNPSLMDIMQAMQIMHPPAAPVVPVPVPVEKDNSVTKLIIGGVVGFIGIVMMAVFLWVGSSVNGLNQTVTKMSANVDQLQKSITDLQQTQGSAAQQLSDLKITNTRQDARDDAIEAEMKRVKDRVRMAEGQKPVSPDGGM